MSTFNNDLLDSKCRVECKQVSVMWIFTGKYHQLSVGCDYLTTLNEKMNWKIHSAMHNVLHSNPNEDFLTNPDEPNGDTICWLHDERERKDHLSNQ